MLLRLLAALLTAVQGVASHAVPQLTDDSASIERVVDGLTAPSQLAFLGPGDFLVLEQTTGQVRRVTHGMLEASPVLDLAVEGCGERGLLGIAAHPDLVDPVAPAPLVYLYYTPSHTSADTSTCFPGSYRGRLDRCSWNGATLEACELLYLLVSDQPHHNGGVIAFGPDGKLYGVIGDNDHSGELQNDPDGEDPADLGAIFRLADDGSTPPDNLPMPFGTGRTFAYGIRNSLGLAFDPFSGHLWESEIGDDAYDEINRFEAGDNGGWHSILGPASRRPDFGDADLVLFPGWSYRDPKFSWLEPVAPTGLAFAGPRSALAVDRRGDLFLGDLRGDVIRLELNGRRDGFALGGVLGDRVADGAHELEPLRVASGFDGGISDLEEGPDGGLYVVAQGLGAVYRLSGRHDLSILRLTAPRRVRFPLDPPAAKPLELVLRNQGNANLEIEDAPALSELIVLSIESLGTCEAPGFAVQPPKRGFPLLMRPGQKVSIRVDVHWQCVNDPAASTRDEDHSDYQIRAGLGLEALGEVDGSPANDFCPRAASGDDRGCGGRAGDPIRVDLVAR